MARERNNGTIYRKIRTGLVGALLSGVGEGKMEILDYPVLTFDGGRTCDFALGVSVIRGYQ
jgi:hypothetical protein